MRTTTHEPQTEAAQNISLAMDEKLAQLDALLAAENQADAAQLPGAFPATFKVSIVIPVYNEERTICEVLARVAALPVTKEIIIVNDCSTDRTVEHLAAAALADNVRVLNKTTNEGKGAALRDGFALATGDVVVVQDADLEYDPQDILKLLPPLVQGTADVVYGSRFLHERPEDKSLVHRLGNWLLTTASNTFSGLRLTDMETCYKAFRREVIQSIEIKQNRFGFEPEVTAKLARRKCRIVEAPISYNARSYADGKKIGVKDLFNAFWCIVRYGLAD